MVTEVQGGGRIEIERVGPVAVLRLLNPPGGRMDLALEFALRDAVSGLESDPQVEFTILTGGTPGVFLDHYDLAALLARGAAWRERGLVFVEERPVREAPIHEAIRLMEQGSALYLAALDGSAAGGGFELALACDMMLVSPGPWRFRLPEASLGLIPGAGAIQRLVRALGPRQALRLMLSGEALTPDDLVCSGLAEPVGEGSALEAAFALTERLRAVPFSARRALKRLVRAAAALDEVASARERSLFCALLVGEEAMARLAAAIEPKKA